MAYEQIYDFVVYTHNTRFQIEVLALQSLPYGSLGEGSAALESLTNALQLAEPGGLIRLFAGPDPRMGDLLKGLIKQNDAVGYIKRILDSFHYDQSPDHPIPASPRHPFSGAPYPLTYTAFPPEGGGRATTSN